MVGMAGPHATPRNPHLGLGLMLQGRPVLPDERGRWAQRTRPRQARGKPAKRPFEQRKGDERIEVTGEADHEVAGAMPCPEEGLGVVE